MKRYDAVSMQGSTAGMEWKDGGMINRKKNLHD